MAVLAVPQELASHFAPYIQELQELFGLHGVAFGQPGDLPPFAVKLDADSGLAEDVSSLLRSIILREGGAFPQSELLEILTLAIGGPKVDPAAPEVQPGFRELLAFVGSVTSRAWNVPPGQPSPDARPALRLVPAPADETASPEIPAASGETARTEATAPEPPVSAMPRYAGRFTSRPDPENDGHHEAEPAAELPLPVVSPALRSFPSSAPLWIGAVCAVALVLVVALYSHRSFGRTDDRAAALESIDLPDPHLAPPAEPAPKPTADLPAEHAETAPPSKPAPAASHPIGASATFAIRTPSQPKAAAPAASTPPAPRPEAILDAAAASDPDALGDPSEAANAPSGGSSGPARTALRGPMGRSGKGPFFLVSSGIMASHLVESPAPSYPMLARMTHIQGQVVLQAVISTEGEVIATRVLNGHRLLRGAAVAAVKRWRYRPYVLDGHAVNVATIITVDFHSHE